MIIDIDFAGGKQVAAHFPDGLQLLTDQPTEAGGNGSAPSPFACFLGSIGTCAGYYVLEFCTARKIPTAGISLRQEAVFAADPQGKRRLAAVNLSISLPPDFPEKYRGAVVKAAELCAVKKAIALPPDFNIAVTAG